MEEQRDLRERERESTIMIITNFNLNLYNCNRPVITFLSADQLQQMKHLPKLLKWIYSSSGCFTTMPGSLAVLSCFSKASSTSSTTNLVPATTQGHEPKETGQKRRILELDITHSTIQRLYVIVPREWTSFKQCAFQGR